MRVSTIRHRAALSTVVVALSACGATEAPVARALVPNEEAVRVILTPVHADIAVGERLPISATAYGTSGTPLAGASFRWESSDTLVVRVSDQGEVAAIVEGNAVVSARIGGVRATTSLSVHRPKTSPPVLHSVLVSPDSIILAIGTGQRLIAAARDPYGNTLDRGPAAWSSSDSVVATVSDSGVVTAAAAGRAIVTATIDSIRGSSTIIVSPVLVASVVVAASRDTMRVGDPILIRASVQSSDGAALQGRSIHWTSSASDVARVAPVGMSSAEVTAVAAGVVTVTATVEGKSGAVALTVLPAAAPVVAVAPGESIQAAVNAHPAGTTFLLKAGAHVRQSVTPKTGDVFRGEPGTVLDGQNATAFAFRGWNGVRWVDGVTLRALTITRYTPPAQNGAIWGGDDLTRATTGWILDSLEVSYNANLGVRIGNRMQVTNSRLHHNATINIGGVGVGVLIEGNEIAYGNWQFASDPGFESGGTKFVRTDSLIVRNNYVHHNGGPGIWTDIDNVHVLVEGNRVESNAREGIVHEIGYAAVIRNNVVTGNGTGDPFRGQGWLWNAGIGVHASSDVEVYGNTLSGNANGIVAIQQARGAGPRGPYVVQNLYVHDNIITQDRPGRPDDANVAAGIAQDVRDDAIFATRNNRFVQNTYVLGANAVPFAWLNANRTEIAWRAFGHDIAGAFSR